MKILVVDDSAMIRRLIRNELEKGGYDVIEARHGFEAIAQAAEPPPPDLITLDVEMPKLSGFETCRKIREDPYSKLFTRSRDNMAPIIFVTSLDTIEDRKKGFTLGATDFITKPFKEGEILSAVNKILKPDNRLKGLTALVANNDMASRRIVTDFLTREGVSVVEASDGVEAFAMLVKNTDSIDIVITDFLMPQMNGDALCNKIRTELNLNDLPVIFLTESRDTVHLLDLFKSGASDYLAQPFVKEELLARLMVHLERSRLNKHLRKTLEEVELSNKKILQSIQYAELIQKSILPNEKDVRTYLPRHFALWMPKDIVGGDFYQIAEFDDGILIAVVDCTGHGVPGAFMTMIASSGLRRITRTENCHKPGKILKRLNHIIKTSLQQDKEYSLSDDGLDAAVCLIRKNDSDQPVITYAGAKLPLYYIMDGEINVIKGDRESIGYKRSKLDFEFKEHTVELKNSARVYMTSDGYQSQLGGQKGKCFGPANLRRLLLDIHRLDFESQRKKLIEALEDYKENYDRIDDITIVGFSPTPPDREES